jgi:hypothetical protein
MKRINEATLLSTGNATSLMVFIDLAMVVEKQRGMLPIAFPKLGNKGINKMLRGFASNETYSDKKEQLLGISERFYNNGPIKALYKTLAFLSSQPTKPEESDKRIGDVNRVLSKIERMINGKLTDEEREMFSQMEDSLDNFSDGLNSNLNSSLESSVGQEEPSPEEKPEEKPKEEPKPEEKPKETPKPEEKPKEEPKPEEKPKEEPKPEEKPKEEPKPEEKPKEEPKPEEKPKEKTEEQFRSLIKRLVRESLKEFQK